jgi:hypothetical protein
MQNGLYAALTAICMLVLVAIMAPNIMAMNRGKVLRNIAIWLAIFMTLGVIYQYFVAPGRPGLSFIDKALQQQPQETPSANAQQNGGDKGFTPPNE